jgi:glycosyltransferase involved in cell wall biosynthesis
MKLLLISPFTNASGSSIRFWNIARELSERGHRVVLSERKSRSAPALHSCAGVRYYACPATGVLPADLLISLIFNLYLLMRHFDTDIFYALKPGPNNCIPALVARLIGKRIILDVDDLDYAYLHGAMRTVFRFFFDLFPRMFHLVTFHTPHLHEYLACTARVPENRLYYLAQGVSPDFILPREATSTPPAPGATLIYVATLGHTSDFEDLIPGLATLFGQRLGITMNVVGDGRRKTEFEQTVKKAGLADRIRFTGTIDHAQLPAFMAAHRIGINYMRPSTVNQCRAILKIREYLACGLQVVCNNVGDVSLFEGHIHVHPGINEMFLAISKLLDMPPSPNTAGRSFIEQHYRWEVIVGEFERRLAKP